MKDKKQYKSKAFASVHETMDSLHQVGAVDKKTMDNFDSSCLEEASETKPKESGSRKKHIKNIISQKKNEIKTIDDAFIGEVIGVAQALGQLKDALKKIDACLDRREFKKASSLGYSDVSSEFIFLQRCLGGLNDTVGQKERLIQDVCLELCKELDHVRNEEVAPLVEQEIESLKPIDNPMKIEILLGKKTAEKLQSLQNIRHTPIENLVESILASAMQKDEKYWHELENMKPVIPNIRNEEKEFYTSDEVDSHIEAWGEQHKERIKNLY